MISVRLNGKNMLPVISNWTRWIGHIGKFEPVTIRVWIGYHPEIGLSVYELWVNDKS
jgi:hypothetical protein